jgi:hypothetical protein
MAHALLVDDIGDVLIFGVQPLKLIVGIVGLIVHLSLIERISQLQFRCNGKGAIRIPVFDLLKGFSGCLVIPFSKAFHSLAHELGRCLFFLLSEVRTSSNEEEHHHSHYNEST